MEEMMEEMINIGELIFEEDVVKIMKTYGMDENAINWALELTAREMVYINQLIRTTQKHKKEMN